MFAEGDIVFHDNACSRIDGKKNRQIFAFLSRSSPWIPMRMKISIAKRAREYRFCLFAANNVAFLNTEISTGIFSKIRRTEMCYAKLETDVE